MLGRVAGRVGMHPEHFIFQSLPLERVGARSEAREPLGRFPGPQTHIFLEALLGRSAHMAAFGRGQASPSGSPCCWAPSAAMPELGGEDVALQQLPDHEPSGPRISVSSKGRYQTLVLCRIGASAAGGRSQVRRYACPGVRWRGGCPALPAL